MINRYQLDRLLKYIIVSLIIFTNIIFAKSIDFTQQEIAYIKQKQSVKIVMLNNFKPFSFVEENKHQGLSVEIIDKISKSSGLKFNIQISSWSKALNDFKEKRVDIISGISHTKERERFTLFTKPFYAIPTYIFGLKDDNRYKSIKDLKGKRVGINKDMFYIDTLKKLGIKVIEYEGSNQKIKALVFGNIDYFLANYTTGFKAIKFQSATNIKAIDEFIGVKREDLRYGIDKDNKTLYSIIEKALNQIKKTELEDLVNRWILGLNKLSPKIINFTKEEIDFLQNNPTIKVGVEQWKPAIYSNDGLDIDGVAGDFLKEIIKNTGLKIKVVNDKWSNIISGLENKTIDIIPATYFTKEREKFGLYSDSYFKMKDFIYIKQNNQDIHSLKDLEGKVLAITKSNGRIPDIRAGFPKIKFAFTKDYNEAIDLLLNNQVDAIYDSQLTMDTMLRENMIIGIKGVSQTTFKTPSLYFFSRIDKPILHSILQKGLKSISKQRRDEIKIKWLHTSVVEEEKNILDLTLEQKNYLEEKKVIKMCIDPNWMPFEKVEKGKHIGLSSDYMNLFSQKIGIPIILVETKTWLESLNKAKNRECDILSLASNTPKRKKYMNFTQSYIISPIVIATKAGHPFINDLEQVIDKKLGLTKGYSLYEKLRKQYPSINLVAIDSIQDGLKKVENGELFGCLDDSIVLNHEIQKNFLGTLTISGKLPNKHKLTLATRNDEPILNQIFKKAIVSIDSATRQNILNRWITISHEKKADYTLVWEILILVSIVYLFIVYRQRLLKNQNLELEILVNKKTKDLSDLNQNLEKKVEEKTKKLQENLNVFETLLDSSLEGILIFDDKNNCIEANDKVLEIYNTNNRLDIIGKNVFNFVSKDSFATLQKNFLSKDSDPYEATFLRKNGEEFPALVRGRVTTLNGKSVRISSILDMTDIKNKEKLLLVQSKMASMGEMIGNIAHQWRQPLSVISTAATGMQIQKEYNLLTDEKFNMACEAIDEQAQYLSKTIDDFKNFIKGERTKDIFSLTKNINSFLSLVDGTIKNNDINIILNLQDDIKINSYENELTQCYINIFNNAKDILIENKIENKVIFISTTIIDNKAILKIKDNGGGIPEEVLPKIFEPYFTTKHKSQGTGLGLHMTYNLIVDGMKGNIEVTNQSYIYNKEKYVGAEFSISLEL